MAEARATIAELHAGNPDPVVGDVKGVALDTVLNLTIEDRRARSLRFYAEREANRERAIAERKQEEKRDAREQRAR
jgi:hypothetical protein